MSSLIDTFVTTIAVSLPDGRTVEFSRPRLRTVGKLMQKIRDQRKDEAAQRFAAGQESRRASAGPNPSPEFWATERMLRERAMAGDAKVRFADLWDMIDDDAGLMLILRSCAADAGAKDEDVNDVLDIAPVPELRALATDLLSSPVGDKKRNPTEAAKTNPTGDSSPPSSEASTTSTPAT